MNYVKTISSQVYEYFHDSLINNKTYLNAFINKQGFTLETVQRFKIGFDYKTKRLTFPIMEDNICYNIKLYNPKLTPKYMSYTDRLGQAYGKRRLWGTYNLDKTETVLICAGEKDRMIAEQNGFNAVCSTTGEGNWDKGWDVLFTDKMVIIIYDNDESGRGGAFTIANQLSRSAKVKVFDLSPICKEKGEDLQDFFVKYKKTKNDLEALIDITDFHDGAHAPLKF